MIKIEIKSIFGDVLFTHESVNNTIKETVEEAVKNNANLYNANLYNAYLKNANLENAYLYNANLENAYLYNANLKNAYLKNAYLKNANLENANLENAYLKNAYLYNANIEKDKFPLHYFNNLPEGDIIGYKKVHGKIIKLLIPSEAKRVHAISHRKCRAEFAKVLEIEGGLTEITNKAYLNAITVYKVGEIVKPDAFNDCWLTECGQGINFFINRKEAELY
jgi:hypothetical protein